MPWPIVPAPITAIASTVGAMVCNGCRNSPCLALVSLQGARSTTQESVVILYAQPKRLTFRAPNSKISSLNDKRTELLMDKQILQRDVVIIGSGPAGLTAAIYAGRANLKPLLIDAPVDAEKQTAPGGQLMITTDVENYPGFAAGIQGPELMVEFRKQAERFGTEFLESWITKVELQQRPFTV